MGHDLVEEDQHAHGRHQRRERALQGDEAEAGEVDEIAEGARAECGDQEHRRNRQPFQVLPRDQADAGARDRRRGEGEIELVHHAEDEREADADQRVGRADENAVDDRLD
ncbi:hypothetical protein D3C83_36780 [compost metagenome]